MPSALPSSLYLITDRKICRSPLEDAVHRALDGGVKAVQLREKDLAARELFHLAEKLRALTTRYQARLLINDRIDVARAAGADGVQLGKTSLPVATARLLLGPEALIGFSAHSPEELATAARDGADFATFSPIFSTPSKSAFGPPQGLPALAAACRDSPLPVFALGGITQEQTTPIREAGAAGIAVIRAVLGAGDPGAAAHRFCQAWASI